MALICATFEIKYKGRMFTITFEPTGGRIEYNIAVYYGRDNIGAAAHEVHTVSPTSALLFLKYYLRNL